MSKRVIRSVEPLDLFSFPSGHTLHAVAFSIIACAFYPAFSVVLVPFTVLVAGSRIILGLHYPSDVIAGAAVYASQPGLLNGYRTTNRGLNQFPNSEL